MRSPLHQLSGPARALAVLHGIDGIGVGLYVAGSAVYLTQVTGLTAAQIGMALSAAGVTGLLASVLFGALADRVGARPLLTWLLILLGAGYFTLPAVHAAWQFVALSVAIGALQFGTGPSFTSLIAELIPDGDRVTARAAIRSVGNASMGLGTLGAAAIIAVGSHDALQLFPLINGVTFVAAGLLVRRLPEVSARPAPPAEGRFTALRDLPFLRVVGVNAALSMHDSVLAVAIPLWIVVGTGLPIVLTPVLIGVNTLLCVLLQVRAAKGTDDVSGAARVARRSGAAGAVACLLLVPSGGDVPLWAAGVLVCGAFLVMTAAELWHAGASFGLAIALSPEDRRGEYLGAFQLHHGMQSIIGPAVLTSFIGGGSGIGWAAAAALFAVAAVLVGPAVRAATRPLKTAPAATPAPDPQPAPGPQPAPAVD
ncbi:MFS transporter (plasmid) [Streptomyces sp. NBC_00876]|uniref:MFS transporter n=1 Tax=Streptomyces sp. NBC_00876 TaxID=2975853 RepID=UPI002F911DF6|nr:MFS transporter [Streptomyces sp. NBC_00876]